MTLAELKQTPLRDAPEHELRIPMTEQEFVDSIGDLRAEWANGEAIVMAPENYDHVKIVQWLGSILEEFADQRGLGEVMVNNFESRLSAGSRRVPDIQFVARAREHLIRQTYLAGAPDLAVEVVSPDSVVRDYREKFADYQQSGVAEYWIIDPRHERVDAYVLTEGTYKAIAAREGKLVSSILPGFFLRAEWVWRRPRQSAWALCKELGLT